MPGPANPLEMSDDDFGKLAGPPEVVAVAETDEAKATREAAEAEAATAAAADDGNNGDGGDAGTGDDDGDGDDGDADKTKTNADGDDEVETEAEKAARLADEDDPELDADGKPKPKVEPKDGDDPTGSKAKPDVAAKEVAAADDKGAATPVDRDKPDVTALGAFYNSIMTPFKANGKMIELKSPAEAISLMQMGANYTRKLQDIQPHRKMLMMLENNGLLDEGKLSFLIDLDKKDPEAIKKLVKDSGIDPLDIDLDKVTYRPGDHSVTNDEATFRSTMDDLIKSDPKGQATVSVIYETWDDTSKEVLWKQPELMTAIHEQRESGIYDAITAEVDRLTTLGQIPPNTPFLQSYKAVGDYMVEEAKKTDDESNPKDVAAPKVVVSRAATQKSKLENGDKANAASPTRSSTKAAGGPTNPLAMADEEFLKQMEGRV